MAKIAGRKKRIIVTTAVLAAVGGGAAFAYWTSVGTGSGGAKAAESVPFTVTGEVATQGVLSPGGPGQTIKVTVTNPGSGVQYLTKVTAIIPASWSVGGTTPACTAADFTVNEPVITAGSIDPGESVEGTVTLKMDNRTTNQDSCKGVNVPLTFSAS